MASVEQTFPHGFQWHHRVHEKWGGESLWFSFLAFEPTYRRSAVTEAVTRALVEVGVKSYALYELTGQYDMLVRAWVPDRIKDRDYEAHLEKLRSGQCFSVKVADVVHHWVWQETERSEIGRMKEPEEDLDCPAVARELEALNKVQRLAEEAGVPLDELQLDEEQHELVRRFRSHKLITDPPYETGIKFLVLVRVGNPNDVEQREHVQGQICEVLTKAQGVIWDRSVYFARNGAFQFLVLGRASVDPASHDHATRSPFHQITPRLLDEISRIAGAGGTKTYTHFFPLEGFLAFKDEISVAPAPEHERPDFDRLLKTQESHEFEVKAAAFAAVDEWAKGRASEIAYSSDVEDQPFLSMARAVTSLLNGTGGTVLLGVLEKRLYGNCEPVKDLPKAGQYLLLGLEGIDYDEENFDTYSRALWDKLLQRIRPNPRRWIRFHDQEVEGKTLLAITVEYPDEWFWLRRTKGGDEFRARSNASSNRLQGLEGEQYRKRHPRRGQ
ncbi:MAG: hypothetical protein QOD71_431 [Thermoleophilaceae bacterium]|jgi:hypothetical protein|nr:hypothetical protein [Thermoleophilaceae bacterium]